MGEDEVIIQEVLQYRGFRGSAAEKDADAVYVRGIPGSEEASGPVRTELRPKYPSTSAASPQSHAQSPAATPIVELHPFAKFKWALLVSLLLFAVPVVLSPTTPCPAPGADASYSQTTGTTLLAVEELFRARTGDGFVSTLRAIRGVTQADADAAAAAAAAAAEKQEAAADADAADAAKVEDEAEADTAAATPEPAAELCVAEEGAYEAWRTQTLRCSFAMHAGWVLVSCFAAFFCVRGLRYLPAYATVFLGGAACAGAVAMASMMSHSMLDTFLRLDVESTQGAAAARHYVDTRLLQYNAVYYVRYVLLSLCLLALAQLPAHHAPTLDLLSNALSVPAPMLFVLVFLPSAATTRLFWFAVVGCAGSLFPLAAQYRLPPAARRPRMTREQATSLFS